MVSVRKWVTEVNCRVSRDYDREVKTHTSWDRNHSFVKTGPWISKLICIIK